MILWKIWKPFNKVASKTKNLNKDKIRKKRNLNLNQDKKTEKENVQKSVVENWFHNVLFKLKYKILKSLFHYAAVLLYY